MKNKKKIISGKVIFAIILSIILFYIVLKIATPAQTQSFFDSDFVKNLTWQQAFFFVGSAFSLGYLVRGLFPKITIYGK